MATLCPKTRWLYAQETVASGVQVLLAAKVGQDAMKTAALLA